MKRISEKMQFGTKIELIPEILNFTEQFLNKIGLSEKSYEIQLTIEEWYVNIVKHGFNYKSNGDVQIKLSYFDKILEIEIIDNGPEFDPHSIKTTKKPKNIEEAKIGGLGIYFIRKLMNDTRYERQEGKNSFIMKKKFL